MAPNQPEKTGPASSTSGLLEISSGQYIFKEGELGSEMYIIEKGQVEILKQSEGQEQRFLLLKRGDFFGEESVAAQLPRVVSARAESDCRLLAVDAGTLREILEQGSDVGIRLLQGLSQRFREALRMVPAAAPQVEAPKIDTAKVKKEQAAAASDSGILVHIPSEKEFKIPESDPVLIGRPDAVTGTAPDIDLSSLDTEHSLSRHHAELFRQDGKLFVRDEAASANGTYVNGKRVKKGKPVQLKDGDELRFGLIKTRFQAAG